MDTAFLLNEEARSNFLQLIMHSFGCTYICLWSYLPHPSNWLWFKDGIYHEEIRSSHQPSSSTGSLARRLFDEYRSSVFMLQNDCVPGLALKNNLPYLELKDQDLQRLASIEPQLQFYQEARIKTAIFMGCKSGEIELGFSNMIQIDMETGMKNWFPEDFSRQSPLIDLSPKPTDQNWVPSSSSSSLRSLSMGSPEYSSLLFNIPHPNTSYTPNQALKETPLGQALRPISTTANPLQEAIMRALQTRRPQIPSHEAEHAAMTSAILAVISSPSSSSSSHHPPQQNIVPYNYRVLNQEAGAFKRYSSPLAPKITLVKPNTGGRPNMLKRAISYFKSLNLRRPHEHMQASRPPTSTQLHHMISERKRREKINESFQALRSLLPPGSKRDKASVLAGSIEYLTNLKAQVSELNRKKQLLEAQLLPMKEASSEEEPTASSNERSNIRITPVSESTSLEEQIVDLRVTVRGDCPTLDLVIRILEFIKQVRNLSLMSMEAETQMAESTPINGLVLRLKIEGTEWDESSFQEAIRRIIADLPH